MIIFSCNLPHYLCFYWYQHSQSTCSTSIGPCPLKVEKPHASYWAQAKAAANQNVELVSRYLRHFCQCGNQRVVNLTIFLFISLNLVQMTRDSRKLYLHEGMIFLKAGLVDTLISGIPGASRWTVLPWTLVAMDAIFGFSLIVQYFPSSLTTIKVLKNRKRLKNLKIWDKKTKKEVSSKLPCCAGVPGFDPQVENPPFSRDTFTLYRSVAMLGK